MSKLEMGACHNAVLINSPIEDVWRVIREFHSMSWASEVVKSLTVVGDKKGTEIGSKRILNGLLHETLQTLNDDNHTLSYSIDKGLEPVSESVNNYLGVVILSATSGEESTMAEWSSTFWSEPDDLAILQLHNNRILGNLLKALKESLES